MPLSDFNPETTDIMYKEKVLVTVRGLNLEDIGVLLRRHLADLRILYAMFEPGSGKLLPADADLNALIFNFLTNAPDTAARMIAMASGEPDNIDLAKRLSAPLQMKILIEIAKLTLEDVGGPLEFGALLRKTVQAAPVQNPQTIQ